MKTHTSDFKNTIKKLGRQLDSKITYIINEEEIELGNENLNSVTPYFESSILKSVMKQLTIDSNIEIPIETIINYKFGCLVNNEYEYLDFGNYIVKEVEKQEDANSYKITCYDKMLYAMKDYENLNITYPITIRNYINAICTKLGITFANNETIFVNYDKEIQNEKYLDSQGNSMGYTYRDVLDELAEVTASTILINENDELEIRYVQGDQYEEKTITGQNSLYIEDATQTNTIAYNIDGGCSQDGTPTPDSPIEVETIPSIINLFDKDNANIINCSMSSSAISNTSQARMIYIPITGGNTYTISKIQSSRFRVATTQTTPAAGVTISNYSSSDGSTAITVNTSSTAKYLCAFIYLSTVDTLTPEEIINTIMIEEGSVSHEYIPYGYYTKVKVTGKNIYNKDDIGNLTNYNLSGTTGAVSSNSSRNTSYFIRIEPSTKYILSGATFASKCFYNDSKTFISSTSPNNFTTPSNARYMRFAYDNTVDFSNIQLELGETSTTYEAYKENQVLIDMSKENFFDSSNYNEIGGYYVDSTGKIVAGAYNYLTWVKLQPNTTYNLAQPKRSNVTIRTALFNSEPVAGATGTLVGTYTGTTGIAQTFTTTSTNIYLAWVYCNTNNLNGYTKQEMIDSITLFEGNNPTPYYELCRIGDYKDTLSIDSSGNVVINKNVGKVILNGGETYTQSSSAGYKRYNTTLQNGDTTSARTICLSNYFNYPEDSSNRVGICFVYNSLIYLYPDTNITSTNDFKTWLSTHNTDVYYPLATPEVITLPNVTIPLYDGINHVIFMDRLNTTTKLVYNTPNIAGEIIDEEYLKDINVNFGKKYGDVNTIVFSRSAGTDKISQSIPEDLSDDDKVAIIIEDNQILNGNDRATYMSEILNKLYGLNYYLNDYSSTGITYLDICDRYYIKIGDDIYSCVMFNDEINITQGLEESIHTEMPEYGETDYKKTDKTDQKMNQTYLIVDKQNQTIESVVSNVTEQNTKISQITQTVDEINQKIGEITDITVSGESLIGEVSLEQVNASEPITIKVRPLNTNNNISYLYPNSGLYPSSILYPKIRTIRFIRTYIEEGETHTENIDYKIPDDLLYYDSTHYDEFYLNYDSQTCQIIKKCKYNSDGTVGLLEQEQVVDYPYPTISLGDGDYEIKLLGYDVGYLFVTLMASNIYTTQFATKVEMESAINQTAQQIELGVSQTLSNYSTTTEMNSAINIKANEINSVVSTKVGNNEVISRINQTAEQIKIDANKINIAGTITAINNNTTTTINGNKITTGTITADKISAGTITADKIANSTITASNIVDSTITGAKIADATITSAKISSINADKISAGTITTSSINLGNGTFSVNTNGYLQSSSGKIGGWTISRSSLSVTWSGYTIQLGANGITASYSGGSITASWYDILRRLGYLP